MTRYLYGGSPADFTTTARGHIEPNVTVTVWTEQVGGVQVTDLLDYAGNATTVAVSDGDGLVRFYAPDGVDGPLWLYGGAGATRLLIRPVDLPPVTADGVDTVHLRDGAVTDTKLANNAVTTDKIANGTIVDEDVSASAAIAKTKISGTAITAADSGTVTSTMIADGTIVNADIAGSAAIDRSKISGLPTTTTDNAVARFDGTTGALQNSGVTISDSNNVSIPGSTPSLDIEASGGESYLSHWGGASMTHYHRFIHNNTQSFVIAINSDTWDLRRGGLTSGLSFDNGTGKVTIGSVGSTAGIELGSSGPRMMVGTGGPSGISAPVGSTWRQTDANSSHGSLSGLLWNKVGTGTTEGTDWLVDYEGRWVSYTPTLTASTTNPTNWTQTGYYMRAGKLVICKFKLTAGASVTAGSGTYRIALPVNANTTIGYGPNFAYALDSSASSILRPHISIDNTAYVVLYYPATWPTGANTAVASATPFAWASGDTIGGALVYEAA